MQETENIAGEHDQEIVAKVPITQAEIEQIRKVYKLDFPCPHCKERINDDHFGKEQRVLQLIDEKLREIINQHLNSRKNYMRNELIEEIKKNRAYEDFPEVKELRQDIEKFRNRIIELDSSEHVEGLSRVKELKEENEKLREQNQLLQHLSKKGGQEKGKEFEKWFLEELQKVFDDRDNIIDVSRGQSNIGKRGDFLQEVFTENEPRKIAGRIIYETKNTKDWSNEWIAKLEKDMETHRADYGFIIATCENDKPIRPLDSRKKIYISGDNINIFIVAKIMRELLITKCNFETMVKSDEKEQKIKNLKEWIEYKLPRYISILEDELSSQEKEADIIIREAGKIKKSKERIWELTKDKIVLEIENISLNNKS